MKIPKDIRIELSVSSEDDYMVYKMHVEDNDIQFEEESFLPNKEVDRFLKYVENRYYKNLVE